VCASFAVNNRHRQKPDAEDPRTDPDGRRAALVCRTQTEGHGRGQPWQGYADLGTARRGASQARRATCCQGVKPGDFVAIGLPNGNAFFETNFAVWKCGATPTSLSWRLPRGEAAAVLDILKPSLVVGGQPDWNAPNSLPADFVPDGFSDEPIDNPVARYWKAMTSGGSTGRPKVILDHKPAVVDTAGPAALGMPLGASLLNPGPLYHNAPFIVSYRAVQRRTRHRPREIRRRGVLRLIEPAGCSGSISCPP
jgi:acyl-CoA synthetase (AMP-forming)/AMP-acid ligase II